MIINGIPLILRKVSGGRIVPTNNYETAEKWHIPPGSLVPGWMWVQILFFLKLIIISPDRQRLRGKGSVSPDRSQVGDVDVAALESSYSRSGAELEKVDTRP
jgi:hypothetical protein